MIKGGQQFFSNYLKAFRETVDKLTELVNLAEQTVPKFALASDNVKKILYEDEEVSVHNHQMITYVGGQIRLKLKQFKVSGSGKYTISVNDVVLGTYSPITGVVDHDLSVNEGDMIIIKSTANSMDWKTRGVSIAYDLINKPDIVGGQI